MSNPIDDATQNREEIEKLDDLQVNYDDVDVPGVTLKREFTAGPGDALESLPESDFESFATDDVEQEETK